MGFENNDEGELDDQKAENIKDEKDDVIRENEDDTIWDKIDWSEDNSKEQSDSIWNEIDWTDDNSGEKEDSIWNEIDWTDDNSGEKEDSIWNEINWNEDESREKEIDERENLDDESDAEKNNSNEQQEERNEEDLHENLSSQSTSTVLVSENIEEIQEIDHGQDELEREIEKELEEGVEPINQYLEEETEFIKAYQEMVGEAKELDEELKQQGEEPLKTEEEWKREIETAAYNAEQLYGSAKEIEADTNTGEISEINEELELEKEVKQNEEVSEAQLSDLQEEFEERMNEIEQHQIESAIEEELETKPEPIVNDEIIEELQEMELEEQFQTVNFSEYIEELVEKQEEKFQEHDKTEQEIENIEQTQEVIQQSTYLQEQLDEQEQKLELEYEEKDKVEQHQVETAIEEELETEPKPIIHEKELEYVKNFEPEKQLDAELLYELIGELTQKQNEEKDESEEKEYKENSIEEKVAHIMHDLEITQELKSAETEVEPNRQEEKLVEQEEDLEKTTEENYEIVKSLYKQQTGKRPIYANQETKGFKQWLEQKKQEAKEKQESKKEQKEEAWKWTLKNWIEEATEIDYELKSELRKLVEEYDELEKVVKKFTQLYKKAKLQKLSQAEKNELDSLFKSLQKHNPIKISLFLSIREMKYYLDERYYDDFWDKQRVNQIRSHFFTHLSQQYNNLKLAQKKKENSEIIKNWIDQSSEKEMSTELKLKLNEVGEKYNELDRVATSFMKLYTKTQREKLSKIDQNELDSLVKTLQKIEPSKIELFAKLRAFKRYLNDQTGNLEKKYVSLIFNLFFTGDEKVSNFSPLTSEQIQRRELKYQKMLEKLCVKYAEDFKNIIIEEYGYHILDIGIPLSSHFSFRLDKYIKKVTHTKERRAVSSDVLQRVREHIVEQYSKLEKDTAKEASFKKVMGFIKEYQEFYSYVSRGFSISNIRYQQNSKKLAPRSWLIENLRYIFPKKFGLPISDNILSWFVYGDTPSYGRVTRIKWTMDKKEISKRMHIADLLAIDYRVNKLTKESFNDKGIEISSKNLEILKKSVSYLTYHYIFGKYHDSTYVSETTSKGLPVGKDFFTIEYEVIRAIFFAATEANDGIPVNFEFISSEAGVSDLKHHLYEGFGFGDDFDRLFSYFKQLSLGSSSQIYKNAKEVLEGYLDAKRARSHEFQGSQEYKSSFQGKVHKAMEDFFGIKFVSEEQVRSVVKDAYIDTINDDGVKEKIYVHGAFAFDLYRELNRDLKDYLGLDVKWKGLAIEAMGTYWHSLPRQKEADRKKRLICKERNIILLEISEALDRTKWCSEVLKQFKEKTGVEIPPNKLNNLYKYLGKL